MTIALVYILVVIVLSWFRPMWGVALAANAFLVNAIIGGDAGAAFVIVGLGGPLLCFITLLIERYFGGRSYSMPISIEGYAVGLLFISLLVSSIYSMDAFASIEVAIRFLFLCAGFYFFVRFVLSDAKNTELALRDFLLATLVIGVVVSIYALTQGQSASKYVMRLTIGDTSPIPLSILIGQSLLISLFMLITSAGWGGRLLYFMATGVLLYAEILTNTRSSIIGIALALVVFFAMSYRYFGGSFYLKLLLILFLSFIMIAVFLVGSEDLYQRLFSGFGRMLSGEFGESEGDRVSAWLYALELFSNNILLGVGAGNFGQYYIAYPHNILLELLSENGLIGLFLLLIIILSGLLAMRKMTIEYQLLIGALYIFTLFIAQV